MGLAAAGSKSSRNAENNNFLPSAELSNVHLGPGVVLEQVHGGDGVTNCNWGHFTNVKLSTENI